MVQTSKSLSEQQKLIIKRKTMDVLREVKLGDENLINRLVDSLIPLFAQAFEQNSQSNSQMDTNPRSDYIPLGEINFRVDSRSNSGNGRVYRQDSQQITTENNPQGEVMTTRPELTPQQLKEVERRLKLMEPRINGLVGDDSRIDEEDANLANEMEQLRSELAGAWRNDGTQTTQSTSQNTSDWKPQPIKQRLWGQNSF